MSSTDSRYKILWFALISLLLGPFALWAMLDEKKRRQGLHSGYFANTLLLGGCLAFTYAFLFFAPLHWSILAGVYLAASAFSSWSMTQDNRSAFFRFSLASDPARSADNSLSRAFLVSALAIYPLAYTIALIRSIGELQNFSIRLPSDVYRDGMPWMAYATPVVILAALTVWKSSLKPGLRILIFFYGAVLTAVIWIIVWEHLDQFLLSQVYGMNREPLLFGYAGEARYRHAVEVIFYLCSSLLGAGYLIGAARTGIFVRRAFFLGLPSLLFYINMLFLLGDWNYYLSAMRDRLYQTHHYTAYRFVARTQLLRTPDAYRSPFLTGELLELEYQTGHEAKARDLLRELVSRCRRKPYYAKLGRQARRELENWERNAPSNPNPPPLDLPVIKPASFLDQNWYALLSAAAYLNPAWTDLELKKKLLELSGTVQLMLPKLGNLPDLTAALRQLDIPYSVCFLTTERIKAALGAKRVPFLNFYGRWVPISGYDFVRDGFYYYAYRPSEGVKAWFHNEDIDLFYDHREEAFGGQAEKKRSGEYQHSLQKFVGADELADHIRDIGGVGLILGDSSLADAKERRAAFLVEQGDVFYQDQDNYEAAAQAYRAADSAYASDYVQGRMLYLQRRYAQFAADPRDYRNLFREPFPPAWMTRMGISGEREKTLTAKLLEGKLGVYLMSSWHVPPLPDTTAAVRAAMDTALALFEKIRDLQPDEPLFLDSLAMLYTRKGDYLSAEKRYGDLIGYYPFGNEYACYRMAWIEFKLGKFDALETQLSRCPGFSEDARYLMLQGALAMHQGRYRRAYAKLSKSLKLDKASGETHALLADYYRMRGDKAAAEIHLQWLRRGT